jgi:hypothetical protein
MKKFNFFTEIHQSFQALLRRIFLQKGIYNFFLFV